MAQLAIESTIHITPAAMQHFQRLLSQEQEPKPGLRIFIDQPGAPKSEVGMSFCSEREALPTDYRTVRDTFMLYIDAASAPFLKEATVDYQEEGLEGTLVITAPHIHGQKPDENSDLQSQIQYVLDTEINPQLAHHGGHVTLKGISEEGFALLQFQGGCQGCGMADVTLKQGIERTLLARFEVLTGVRDATDHAAGTQPYYAPRLDSEHNTGASAHD